MIAGGYLDSVVVIPSIIASNDYKPKAEEFLKKYYNSEPFKNGEEHIVQFKPSLISWSNIKDQTVVWRFEELCKRQELVIRIFDVNATNMREALGGFYVTKYGKETRIEPIMLPDHDGVFTMCTMEWVRNSDRTTLLIAHDTVMNTKAGLEDVCKLVGANRFGHYRVREFMNIARSHLKPHFMIAFEF